MPVATVAGAAGAAALVIGLLVLAATVRRRRRRALLHGSKGGRPKRRSVPRAFSTLQLPTGAAATETRPASLKAGEVASAPAAAVVNPIAGAGAARRARVQTAAGGGGVARLGSEEPSKAVEGGAAKAANPLSYAASSSKRALLSNAGDGSSVAGSTRRGWAPGAAPSTSAAHYHQRREFEPAQPSRRGARLLAGGGQGDGFAESSGRDVNRRARGGGSGARHRREFAPALPGRGHAAAAGGEAEGSNPQGLNDDDDGVDGIEGGGWAGEKHGPSGAGASTRGGLKAVGSYYGRGRFLAAPGPGAGGGGGGGTGTRFVVPLPGAPAGNEGITASEDGTFVNPLAALERR